MRKLNVFLAGVAIGLFAVYAGLVIQRAWLQAQHDMLSSEVRY